MDLCIHPIADSFVRHPERRRDGLLRSEARHGATLAATTDIFRPPQDLPEPQENKRMLTVGIGILGTVRQCETPARGAHLANQWARIFDGTPW
ncbi:hypothetical protein GCM10009789_79060 [Kribbella sancticallisti]|uniref:Uncharacterized protein n=1 Tax=Kribbella sancticallisti TaxID=460087 RepID=A0ABN2ERS8_9ACTN